MNKLTLDKRVRVISALMEGAGVNATARMTGVSKPTILKLVVDLGTACARYHDEHVRGVAAKRVQCDEVWSFTRMKQKNIPECLRGEPGIGDTWTWVGLDADSKLVISWLIGGRSADYANMFMQDVAARLHGRCQLTTDGHRAYLDAVDQAFGIDVDFAQLVKLYGETRDPEHRYSPADCVGCRPTRIMGNPDPKHVSTSYVERLNLSLRMHIRRYTRLTNGHSKKISNHAHHLAIYFTYYNFVRLHQSIRSTPAMSAGIAKRLWEMEDLVALLDA